MFMAQKNIPHYNQFAGQRKHRIEALSDGVFAIALTLLVLDIKVPVAGTIKSEMELIGSFFTLMPEFLAYLTSFLTLGIFWTGQSAQFHFIEKSDRNLNWISLVFLAFVSLLPFSTAFLSEHITFKFALAVYWLNIFFLGLLMYLNWTYAYKHNFISTIESDKKTISYLIKKRIIVAQSLYLAGALLCFINTYLSIAVIIAIQFSYAFAIFNSKWHTSGKT